MDERDWEDFKAKLKRKTEIDLDLYKAPQMQRRIMNLARRNGYDK
ncbi:MAG: chemotaxis protein CheR, partial [Selenomonadaceae bacterium]|nr:chemotaxis protein CheR [Selenomonadaceae bacterium]